MKKVFSSLLVPGMTFLVNPEMKKLILRKEGREFDFSRYVMCWENFKFIMTKDKSYEWEKVILKKGPDKRTLVFYNNTWEDIPDYDQDYVVAKAILSPKLFDDLKIKILKTGNYYIDVFRRKLIYRNNGTTFFEIDVSNLVSDFTKFNLLGIEFGGDVVKLLAGKDGSYCFIHYPLNGSMVNVDDVISFDKDVVLIEYVKEEVKMTDKREDELREEQKQSLEEKIEQLEKEKETLRMRIKNQAKYDEMRKAGDDLALAMKAMQDSGFSREEALHILTSCAMYPLSPRRR